jgi:hypothetical protein
MVQRLATQDFAKVGEIVIGGFLTGVIADIGVEVKAEARGAAFRARRQGNTEPIGA